MFPELVSGAEDDGKYFEAEIWDCFLICLAFKLLMTYILSMKINTLLF